MIEMTETERGVGGALLQFIWTREEDHLMMIEGNGNMMTIVREVIMKDKIFHLAVGPL